MSRFPVLPLLLVVSLLSACDDQPSSPPPGPESPSVPMPTDEPAPSPVAPVDPVPEPKPEPAQTPETLPEPGSKVVEDTSLPKPADSKPKPAAKVAKDEELPPARLDLHLPRELVEQIQPDEPLEELTPPALLPEMFVEKPQKPGPFELSGRLITNDHGDSDDGYWDSVEGAELQFKFRN